MSTDSSKYWLAFASIEKIGSVFIKTVYERFCSAKSAFCAGADDLFAIETLTKKQVNDFLKARENTDPDKCLEYIKEKGVKFVTFDDAEYPEMLRRIDNPPMTLFYKGDLNRCNFNRTLSVVGSRKASEHAKNVLSKILSEFKGTDICVVSGLALGIDTTAHKAALKNGLTTIGCIASGFDFVYPSQNRDLYKQIEDTGGVIFSEYWPTFLPIQWRFPHRNRVVTGLSKGTLVAEAALKSGAIISANLCLEQGRELMCMPGLLTNPNTEGIYKLIKNGAAVVTCAQDILDALDWEIRPAFLNGKNSNAEVSNGDVSSCELSGIEQLGLSDEEETVFSMIARNGADFDEILTETGLDFGELTVVLTNLEIDGKIKQSDGGKYISLIKF